MPRTGDLAHCATGRQESVNSRSFWIHSCRASVKLIPGRDSRHEWHPAAIVLAHPECAEAILRHADYVGSTTGILKFAQTSPATEFIVATESGLLHQMEKACPGKTFIVPPGESGCSCSECPHMKRNTMEKLYLCMRDRTPEITINEELRLRALHPIERMLQMR